MISDKIKIPGKRMILHNELKQLSYIKLQRTNINYSYILEDKSSLQK